MAILRDFRKTWTPLVRIAASSIADVVADWFYYDSIVKSENPELIEKYELYLFIFFFVAATMGGLTLISLLMKGCVKKKQRFCFSMYVEKILALEILLEDIPQFVLTTLITYEQEELTPMGVFNITTSAFNFVFNILDMLEPTEEVVEESKVEPTYAPATVSGPDMSGTGYDVEES